MGNRRDEMKWERQCGLGRRANEGKRDMGYYRKDKEEGQWRA